MSPTAFRRAQAYASVNLDSRADGSGPHEVVLMLFEGLLERIQLGKRALEQRDQANKMRHIDRAIQILSEGLRTHLDLKAGGELAQQLDSLYAYCLVRLLDANARNDAGALDEVSKLLQPVADAWRDSRPGASPTPGGASAAPGGSQPGTSGAGGPSGVGARPARYADSGSARLATGGAPLRFAA